MFRVRFQDQEQERLLQRTLVSKAAKAVKSWRSSDDGGGCSVSCILRQERTRGEAREGVLPTHSRAFLSILSQRLDIPWL